MKKIAGNEPRNDLALLGIIGFLILSSVAQAQDGPKASTSSNAAIHMHRLADGYRATKIIGSTVYNGNNEPIGKVDDIMTSLDEHDNYLVIAVGGFLGMGSKLVIMPYQDLKITNDKLVLSGATKNALKALPDFHYAP